MVRFNPPPHWPTPPPGWVPPAGWRPDPSWGPAPAGWRFWVEDEAPAPRSRRGVWIAVAVISVLATLAILGGIALTRTTDDPAGTAAGPTTPPTASPAPTASATGAPPSPTEATPSPDATAEPGATPAPTNIPYGPAGEGSDVSVPLPVGSRTVLRVEDRQYTIRIGSLQPDVNGEVRTEEGAAPSPGSSYVMVPVTVEFAGEGTTSAWDDVRINLAVPGPEGSTTVFDEALDAYAPDDLVDQPELSDGITVTGNVPFLLPDEAAGPVVAIVSLTDEASTDVVFVGPVRGDAV